MNSTIETTASSSAREFEPRVEDAPAVRVLREIEQKAIAVRASDIHLEPAPDGGRVRMRVDGILVDVDIVDHTVFGLLLSRVKLLAGMDIADRRQPQDGRFTIERDGHVIDARAASMPTIDGEKVVIRLLDLQARGPSLDRIGMSDSLLRRYRRLIFAPYGFVIVSGPTGSGKTTTLYSSLRELNDSSRSICTVEDPVEMKLDGVSQVNVNVRAGLSFAKVLRSSLRQDPNVMMIGEMRDSETASVAIRAALSGQLVLTTLHSNDAPRTVERLIELGLDRHAIAAALNGIVAQRLVRRLCTACRAAGCSACKRTGYQGRTGIFEILEVEDDSRDAIASAASISALAEIGKRHGYEPLLVDGMAKVASGETSMSELRRVLSWPE